MSTELHPEALLERRVQGTLSPRDAETLGQHLETCGLCRLELQVRADADAELTQWTFDPAVVRRAMRRAKEPPPRTAAGLVAGAAIGAAMLAAVVGLASLRAGTSATRSASDPSLAPDRATTPSGQMADEGQSPTATRRPAADPKLPIPAAGNPPSEGDAAADPGQRGAASGGPPSVGSGREQPSRSVIGGASSDGRRPARPREPGPAEAGRSSTSASVPGQRHAAGTSTKGRASTDPQPPTRTAATLFAEATAARRRGEVDTALRLLKEASRLEPRSRAGLTALVAAARIQLEAKGNARRALGLYRLYLRRAPNGTLREEAEAGVARAKERLEGRRDR